VISVTAELDKLIAEEQSAMKARDDARKKSGEIIQEAGTKARAILKAAEDESAFQAFVEERSREIEERRRDAIEKGEAGSGRLAELAERNLERAVGMALKRVLGPST